MSLLHYDVPLNSNLNVEQAMIDHWLSFMLQFIPLPSVAGFYLARFFTKKSVSSYFAFVVLGSLMMTWFVIQVGTKVQERVVVHTNVKKVR